MNMVLTVKEQREQMMEELRKGICEVTFTKVNGDKRVASATLSTNHVPAQPNTATYSDGQPKTRKVNEETVVFWDMNNEGVRSFRVDSVISFERLTGVGVKDGEPEQNQNA
jgi:hypothetical protein